MPPDLDGDDLRELYANFFKVGHNSAEFLLDFGTHFDDAPEQIHQRVITTPGHAKILSGLLQKSLRDYEERFGPISEGEAS